MANLGDVLAALGQVAVTVERAGTAVNEAETAFGNANSALNEALAGSNDGHAGDATHYMAVAIGKAVEADEVLHGITKTLSTMVERIANPGDNPVPPGAWAARAPVAGRGHPTHTPAPPPDERDHDWAAQVGAQLTKWERGKATEALVFDTSGQDWQVNSGVDAELGAAAKKVIADMISSGEVATSADPLANQAERTGVRQAATHAETKAAAWAAANRKTLVDVVINRGIVCGQTYRPGDRLNPPGCAQVIAAILPHGHTMRVWRRGEAAPLVIIGRGKKG